MGSLSESLKESFKLLVKHCFKLISNLRETFPITENRLGLLKLESVLSQKELKFIHQILNKIFNSDAFKCCLPFQNSLIHELSSVIKNASTDWVDKNTTSFFRKSEDDNLKKLIELCYTVYLDLLTAQRFYDPIFKNEINIDYFTILYKKIDPTLINLVEKVMVEEFGEDIKKFPAQVLSKYGQSLMNSPDLKKENENSPTRGNLNSILNYVTITEQISINLFELYSLIYVIFRMKSCLADSDQLSLNILRFYELFYMPYKRWIDLIKKRVDNKIDKCFDSEKVSIVSTIRKDNFFSKQLLNM
ncbi:BAI1-associated 3-like [Brachionus plicatilis]|uniref:BAI1-associated 3-like n=1 Tax=Brachionus plicatilis TaxID=10195 RepID=A0A3M7QE72_BRAPC|nr:BAI1-associated 3-like [Brachionus plicatilis]